MKAVYSMMGLLAVATAFADTTVETGIETINGNGEAVELGVVTVGTKSVQDSPTLILTNGTFKASNRLYLQKGNGTSDAPRKSTLVVAKDASLEMRELSTGTADGTANFRTDSELIVDGGTVVVGQKGKGSATHGYTEHAGGTGAPRILVKNGGRFDVNYSYYNHIGLMMPLSYNDDSKPKIEVSSGGVVGIYQLLARRGAQIEVDHGTLCLNRTIHAYYYENNLGDVLFNGATLTSHPVPTWANALSNGGNMMTEWFHNFQSVKIGADGLTMDVPGVAKLETAPVPADGAQGTAKMLKTGSGKLQMDVFGAQVPLEARAGSVVATRKVPSWTSHETTYEQTADAAFAIRGKGALANGTLHPAADGLKLKVETDAGAFHRDAWNLKGWALIDDDGSLTLVQTGGYNCGAAWKRQKIDVTRSFTLTFEYGAANVLKPNGSYGGVLAVWQNCPQGIDAIGGDGSWQFGYLNRDSFGSNSFAAGIATSGSGSFRFFQNKEQVQETAINCADSLLETSTDQKSHVTIRYDADANAMTISLKNDGSATTWSATRENVDLAALTGGQTAYFGFTGGRDYYRETQHVVSRMRLVYDGEETTPGLAHVSGTIALDAGRAYDVEIDAPEMQRGVVAANLSYGAEAKLRVGAVGMPEETPAPPQAPAFSPDEWDLAGGAGWLDDGSLSLANPKSGGAASRTTVRMTEDWTVSFDMVYRWKASLHYDYVYMSLCNRDSAYTSHDYALGNSGQLSLVMNPKTADGTNGGELLSPVQIYGGTSLASMAPISLVSGTPIHTEVSYDSIAKKVHVKFTQQDEGEAEPRTCSFESAFDAAAKYADNADVRIMFHATLNDPVSDKFISNLKVTYARDIYVRDAGRAVGFDHIEPSAPGAVLVKKGSGDLVVAQPGSDGAKVRLVDGTLVLKKTPIETVRADAEHGDWEFSDLTGAWGAHGGLKLNSTSPNNANNAVTRNKVAVSGDWRASFKINLEGQTEPADAICFFIQNAGDGRHQVGGSNISSSWTGVQGIAVGWTVYPLNGSLYSRVDCANCRTFNFYTADAFGATLNLPNATTDVVLEYNAAAETLSMTMTQGAATFSKTWSDINVAEAVGGDFAYLGFGTGGGGAHARPEFVDFKFERLSQDDPTSDMIWLGGVQLTEKVGTFEVDTPLDGSKVRVGSVSVPAGVVFAPTSANGRGVVAVDILDAEGGDEVAIDTAGADVRIASVAPGVANLVVSGGGKIILPAGESLKDCTISLAADGTSIYIEGRVLVMSVFSGGVMQRAGHYAPGDAAWISGADGGVLKTVRPVKGLSVMLL